MMHQKEHYSLRDPFLGKDVQISHDLCDRLRGRYACGPTMENGEPEFGWREFETPPVQKEAAEAIEALRRQIEAIKAEEQAVMTLLYTDDVFVGSHWEDFPNAEKGLWPALCAHVCSYGADAEEIPREHLLLLSAMVKEHGCGAIQAWAAWRRGADGPIKGSLDAGGRAALAALRSLAGDPDPTPHPAEQEA